MVIFYSYVSLPEGTNQEFFDESGNNPLYLWVDWSDMKWL